MKITKPYGWELVLDLHECDVATFTRRSIEDFMIHRQDMMQPGTESKLSLTDVLLGLVIFLAMSVGSFGVAWSVVRLMYSQ